MNEELILKAMRGDDESLIACLQSISSQMTWTAFSLLGDEDAAKDCIMETTLKVYKSRKQVKEAKFFKTWIIRILINECKNELKRRNKFIELDEAIEIPIHQEPDLAFVNEELGKLPFDLKQIIVMYFFDELNFREIGEVLQTPQSTVKSRYALALRILRVEMEKYEQ
jgi:RNA polymerase sigma-70 factor (ECF subfamily)